MMGYKKKRHLPDIIERVGFDFYWDERKVWKLDAPVEEIPLTELAWHFDVPFLRLKSNDYVTPREVIDRPGEHPGEYRRTMRSDTRYPIDIMRWKGRWVILDGLHRLMKQAMSGADAVRVRKISSEAIPLILKD